MAKVVVGLSGGVDSSVAAYLLKEQGHEVIGVFMRNWDSLTNNDIKGNDENGEICSQETDFNDAKKVADKLGIPIHRVDFVKEYWDLVFQDFISEYKKGRTPNPDMLCNKHIKFDHFANYVFKNFNCDFIATGHYARVEHGKKHILKKGVDSNKDQTYFLAYLSEKQLEKVLFPVGELEKPRVREIAKELGLATADKKDSTGICFIGERDFKEFLQNYITAKEGDVVDITTGKVIGRHIGVMYYTIGQRKGLGLGGLKEGVYVCGNDPEKNILYVAPESDESYLISTSCTLSDVNWINGVKLGKMKAKFRYRQEDQDVEVFNIDGNIVVKYEQGVKSVSPGQACVFYDGDICLGGGVINDVK